MINIIEIVILMIAIISQNNLVNGYAVETTDDGKHSTF